MGFIVAKVEQRVPIPGMFVTRDAFNCGDLLIAKPGWGVALVQVTTTGHLNERQEKALDIHELRVWLESGGRFILQGWAKRGARGKVKLWALAEREVKLNGEGLEPHSDLVVCVCETT
jgi:hypothetical protein